MSAQTRSGKTGLGLGLVAALLSAVGPAASATLFVDSVVQIDAGTTDLVAYPSPRNQLTSDGRILTEGCAAQLFCPDDVVTRGQMAAFIHRAKT